MSRHDIFAKFRRKTQFFLCLFVQRLEKKACRTIRHSVVYLSNKRLYNFHVTSENGNKLLTQKRHVQISNKPRSQEQQYLTFTTFRTPLPHSLQSAFKGTQDWEFFWLRFWNLRYFFVSCVKILRFYKKKFLIGPLLGEVRFFRVVLGLRGMKKNLELGPKIFFLLLQFWTLNMPQY